MPSNRSRPSSALTLPFGLRSHPPLATKRAPQLSLNVPTPLRRCSLVLSLAALHNSFFS